MRDARVGEEQVDRSERLLGRADQVDVAGFGADVFGHTDRTGQLVEDRRQTLAVGDHHVGTGLVESPGEGGADAPGRTRHHHVFPVEFHAGHRSVHARSRKGGYRVRG